MSDLVAGDFDHGLAGGGERGAAMRVFMRIVNCMVCREGFIDAVFRQSPQC